MKKSMYFVFVAVTATIISFQASAIEYLVDKMEYIPELNTTCDIKVYTMSAMTISVVCAGGKGGNCSGHTVDGGFSCNTVSGKNNNGLSNGVTESVSWILSNM